MSATASNLSPLAVVKYSRAYLLDLIRYQTGWDQRSEVSDKIQLNYLCKYLEVDHINAKTIVVENEYIDRHYLEDYSEYYARCFPSHPRKCSRVHFFSNEFIESQFISALDSNDLSFINQLSAGYIGYAVIRPIPHTFLAKLCLKRYEELSLNDHCKLIAKLNKLSLFGIPLEVMSAPFLEQDKVVSACATSALWMFFNASGHEFNGSLPSPSAITKSATGSSYDGARTFPNTGLSPTQVARSLKHFGFEPMIFELSTDLLEFKEIIYGYIRYNIPVLIAGSIYQKNSDGIIKHAGKHLVCALGFRLHEQNSATTSVDGMRLISHRIKNIYVHDDRYGPYVSVSTDPTKFTFDKKERDGLVFSLQGVAATDYFVPDLAIVGVYHKIRLTYFDIRSMCDSLFLYLQVTQSGMQNILGESKTKDEAEKTHFKTISNSIEHFLHGICDITLTSNTEIKEQLRASKMFVTFNGGVSKSSCLLQNMPKYIWRCRVLLDAEGTIDENQITDILFDATEVAQGQVLVGYISYTKDAERVWKHVEQAICNNTWATYRVAVEAKQGVSGFLKFFSKKKNKSYLNTLYGPLGLPRRNLKPGEADTFNNIKPRSDIQIIRAGNTTHWNNLEHGKRYIWVINEFGDLVLGEDINGDGNNHGHPTLVDGRPARLGGELYYSSAEACWFVNLKSGTYSSHLLFGSELQVAYLKQISQLNFVGLNVNIESNEEAS
ncbi:MAG: hypothetical protein PHP70_11005 [Gallionella sp.]|nr:hypothetical protein [Gallionella sp.]